MADFPRGNHRNWCGSHVNDSSPYTVQLSCHSTVVSVMDSLVEDDTLMEEILSFCDFDGAIAVGKTCHRLKLRSDAALDEWAGVAAARRDPNCNGDPRGIASRFIAEFDNNDMRCAYLGSLRRGCIREEFGSKESLIEYALNRHRDHLSSYLLVDKQIVKFDNLGIHIKYT